MDLLPTLISTSWASGVNAYATVALLGFLGRAGVGDVPEPLMSDGVVYGALIMYAIEFVTDKVPYLDSAWDLLHTLIRPAIGSAVGVEFADLDHATTAEQALAGGGSGALALLSHGIKAGIRLGVNISPEPVTNIFVSLAEDAAVAGIIVLAQNHPVISAGVASILLAIGLVLVLYLRRRIKIALARRRERRAAAKGKSPPPTPGD